MPMDTSLRPRLAGTVPACRAVVAVRRHRPELEAGMLRALRVLHFSGRLLDEPATLAAAAERVGIDPGELEGWLAEPETEKLLREDMAEARAPLPGALALVHKLAPHRDGHRYTCPSYEVARDSDGASLSIPGFQPVAAYEVAVANLAPDATRREDPEDVREVLEWAGEPLATIEVATICATDLTDARERLGRVADEVHVGSDGLWHLNGVAAVASVFTLPVSNSIQRHPLGVTWVETTAMRRAAHALRADGRRLARRSPSRTPSAISAATELGTPAGVHPASGPPQPRLRRPSPSAWTCRCCASPEQVDDSPFAVYPSYLTPAGGARWRCGGRPSARLVVAEAVGTVPAFTLGRRVGIHPMLRLRPPRGPLTARSPERLLVGHGAAVQSDAAAAIDDALSGALTDIPQLVLKLPSLIRGT